MNQTQLLDKLATLDPDNKDHWNQDDQPRLGALGEGVKREDVLAVAPLFSRKNPVLPLEDAPEEVTEEEIKDEAQRLREEFQAKAQAANDRVKSALVAKQQAEEELEAARTHQQNVAAEEAALDTRTDTQINMDYLASEVRQRMERVLRVTKIGELLAKENLLSSNVHVDSLSPLDRAIAEENIRARKRAVAGSK